MLPCRFALPFLFAASLSAQEPDPVLARLPANTTSLLVVHDVMPHVDALLASPVVRDLLAVTGDIQEEAFGMRFDAAKLRRQVELVRSFVPAEIVVAGSADTFRGLAQLIDVFAAAIVLPQLADLGNQIEDVARESRDAATEALRGMRPLGLLVRVRMRDERTAEGWFDRAVEALQEFAQPGIETTVDDAKATVRVALMQIFDGRLRTMLERAGVRVAADVEPGIVAQFEQRGAELELRIGEPAAGPMPAARLGRLWTPGPDQMLFAKVDPGEAADALGEAQERLSALGVVSPDRPWSMRLYALAANLDNVLLPTTTRIVVDQGFVMVHETEFDEGVLEIDPPTDALLRCIDRDAGPFILSAVGFDAELSGALEQLSIRLAQRGRELPEAFAPFAEFVWGDESTLFGAGTLITTRAAQFRGAKTWELPALPFGAIAVVAQAQDEASAREFMNEAADRLAQGFEIEGAMWNERDLGLGIAAQVLDLARVIPGWAEAGVDADFVPHWLVVDSLLVVSTDPALTKDLVARIRGQGAPPLRAKELIDWSRWGGDHWADVCAGASQWLGHVPADVIGAHASELRLLLDGCAAVFRATDGIETITELDGSTLREVTSVRWRKHK